MGHFVDGTAIARLPGAMLNESPAPSIHEGRLLGVWLGIGVVTVALAVVLIAGTTPLAPSWTPIDLSRRIVAPSRKSLQGAPLMRIAIATMLSSSETYSSYGRLAGYLATRTGARPELVQRGTYASVNALLSGDSITTAFICSGAFPKARDLHGAQLLAVPVIRGQPFYRSYILVPAASPVRSIRELVGAQVALVDPLSLTGCYYLRDRLRQETKGRPFSEIFWTHSHDRSIRLVARGAVQAAAVDSLVYEREVARDPSVAAAVRIIDRSEFFPAPPFVAPRSVPVESADRMRQILLQMHQDPSGAEILTALGIDRFEKLDASAYDVVKDLQTRVDREAGL